MLGHIKETASHPEVEPLGWEEFASLAEQAARPVYAIGGLKPNDLNIARQYHAHGVAGISAF